MLTVHKHPKAVAAAVLPTARRAHLALVAATCGLGCVPALLRIGGSRPASALALVAAGVAAGAAVGWATEDPGRDLLASLPVASSTRAALRIASASLVVLAVTVATVLVLSIGPGIAGAETAALPEAVASGALALAIGLALTRRGDTAVGGVAVTAGVVGTVTVAALAYRWPTLLPSFHPGQGHGRWWAIAAVGSAVALWFARDPAR